VDRPLPRGRERTWQVVSLDLLMEDQAGWDAIEGSLIRRRHHGELPSPTEEVALARIMLQALRDRLTPRQRQVLELRLQGYTREEIGARLGLGQTRVNTIITIIRRRAQPLWEEEPVPAPEPAFATTDELARELHLSRVHVIRLCRQGKVPGARRVGKRWLIPRT
jgi:excisionase family DNA binding protein